MENERRQMLGWVAAATLTAAHLRGRLSETAGILLVADHAFTIGVVLAMLALAAAVGRRLLGWLRVEAGTSLDTLLSSVAVGLGALASGLLLCGALGLLRPAIIVAVLAILAILTRRDLASLRVVLRGAVEELRELAGTPVLAVSALIAGAMLIQALAPPTDYDSLMYHLEIPATFLARHAVHMPDANPMHVAAVGLTHLLYVPLLAVDAPAGPAVLTTTLAIAYALALVATARVALAAAGSRLTLLVLWGSPIVVLVAMTPKVDVTLAFYLALAHHALMLAWAQRERAVRLLLLASVLLGLATGVKYLALPFAVALAPIALAVAWRSGRTGSARLSTIAVPALGFLVAAAPWLLKNQALLGAPLYPYFAERIPAPWLSSLYDGGGFPAGIDSLSVRPLRAVRESFNVADWFTAPERLTPESEARFYRANPLFVLAPAALLLAPNAAIASIAVAAALYFAVLLALGTSINLRYLIPAIGPLTLLSAHVLASVASRIRHGTARRAFMVIIGIVAVSGTALALRHRLSRTGASAHAAGLESRHEYRRTSHDSEINSYTALTDIVNAAVPADGRVLLLFEGRGYYFAPTVVQDNVLTNWVYLEPVVGSRCLEGSGFSHLLVATGTLDYFKERGLDERLIRWERFPAFAARCLEPVTRTPGFELYRVR
jgi:hypothetical protein